MDISDALAILDTYLRDRHLSNIQEIIFVESWQGRTYPEIADRHGYDPAYVRQLGLGLWQLLSQALGEKVSKSNFKAVLGRLHRQAQLDLDAAAVAEPSHPPEDRISALTESAAGRDPSEPAPQPERAVDLGEAPQVPMFVGRQAELDELQQWVLGDRCQLIAVLGMGGVGKTATVAQCVQTIQAQFQYVLWLSLRDAPTFMTLSLAAIQFFSDYHVLEPDLPTDPYPRIQHLLRYLKQQRCLLVLDNAEAILQQGDRCGQYRPGYEAYGDLLQQVGMQQHQSCVLITSREQPWEISQLAGERLPVRAMQLTGLAAEAGRSVVEIKGSFAGTAEHWQRLVELYGGNPLALNIAAASIRDMFQRNVSAFLNHAVFAFDDINDLLDEQFNRLSTLEQQAMYWLAIEREPVTIEDLEANILSSISRRELFEAVKSLVRRSLIQQTDQGFTQQPVVMEYLVEKLQQQFAQELISNSPELLISHALTLANAKEYIQHSQQQVLLEPIVQQLLSHFESPTQLEQALQNLLALLRSHYPQRMGYGAGNILNLFRTLGTDISGYDLSGLTIRQADFKTLPLRDINLQNTQLDSTLFANDLDECFSIAIDPQRQFLAAGGSTGEVTLWNFPDFSSHRLLTGHRHWINKLTFSPDGQWLATASFDHTVRIWQVATAECMAVLTEHTGQVAAVNFSLDGTRLVSAGHDGQTLVWETTSWTCLKKVAIPNAAIGAVAFHPEGQRLVNGFVDGRIGLCDLATGCLTYSVEHHLAPIWGLVFHPNGDKIFTGSHDQTIKVWDSQTAECLDTLVGHTGIISELICVQQGQILASCSHDRTVRLWDTHSGKCLRVLQGHQSDVWGIASGKDDNILISASLDRSIRLWNINTGLPIKTIQGSYRAIWSVAFSPDGQQLISGGEDRHLRVWDVDHQRCLQNWMAHTNEITHVAIHPEGQLIASTGGDLTVKLWDRDSRQCLYRLQGHDDWLWSLTFSPDGRLIAGAGRNFVLNIWDTATGKRLKTLNTDGEHTLYIWSAAFSGDGHLLGTGSYDRTVKLWDTQSWQCVATFGGHENWINSVCFNPQSTLLASGDYSGHVKVWQIQTEECLQTLKGHRGTVWSVVFGPQGNGLASTGFDGTIRLWDVQTGNCLHTLQGHEGYVFSTAFHPDGKRLAKVQGQNYGGESCKLTVVGI